MHPTQKQLHEQVEASGFVLTEQEAAFAVGLASQLTVPVQNICAVLDALRVFQSTADFSGVDPEHLARIEHRGNTLYQSKQYDEAFAIFAGLQAASELTGTPSASAIRGMAACNHCQGFLLDAIDQYREALRLDASDLISCVSLAHCLCLTGQAAQGLALARQALASQRRDASATKLLAQAKAIVEGKGGVPLPEGARRRNAAIEPVPHTPKATDLADAVLATSPS